MFGVELNANIVRALMLGKTSQRAPVYAHAAIAALLVFVYVFTARKMKMYPALLSVIWLIIADIGAGFVLSRCVGQPFTFLGAVRRRIPLMRRRYHQ